MYFLENFSIFYFKIISITIFLFKSTNTIYHTLQKKIVFFNNFKILNKKYLFILNKKKTNLLIIKIWLKMGKEKIKKKIEKLNTKNSNVFLHVKLCKKFINSCFFLINRFDWYFYIQFFLNKRYKKFQKIYYIRRKTINKKINNKFIFYRVRHLILKKLLYKKKIPMHKKSIKNRLIYDLININETSEFYNKIHIILALNSGVKIKKIMCIIWKYFLDQRHFLGFYFKFKKFIYVLKKTNFIKNIVFNYFFCLDLFEKLFRNTYKIYYKLLIFWDFKFKVIFKLGNNLFDLTIFQSFFNLIWQEKIHKNNKTINSHLQIIKRTSIKLLTGFLLKILPDSFILSKWNILF